MEEIPYGFCHCGCGEKTEPIKCSNVTLGYVPGEPRRFISGHSGKGARNWRWNNGISLHRNRVLIKCPTGHRPRSKGYIAEHIVIVERVIGKPLPAGAVIHHIDKNPYNNSTNNLVACQDSAYHSLLHRREKAFKECGNPNLRQCRFCKIWCNPTNMVKYPSDKGKYFHRDCERQYHRDRYAANTEYFKAKHKRVLDKIRMKKNSSAK